MTRTVYVNGDYLPEGEAKVSIFDRGFLMADGVYEVTSVLEGKLIDFDGHVKRLERSLKELEMSCPVSEAELLAMHRELVTRNGIEQGMIYLQVTRGNPGDRSFLFPAADLPGTIVAFTQDIPNLADAALVDVYRFMALEQTEDAREAHQAWRQRRKPQVRGR